MSAASSNIRAFVEWNQQTVFAGEDIACKITFKNIAPANEPGEQHLRAPKYNGFPVGERQRKVVLPPTTSGGPGSSISQDARGPPPSARGHRPALSLNTPSGFNRERSPNSWSPRQNGSAAVDHKHKRSVSIISMGGSEPTVEEGPNHSSAAAARRPSRNHVRSASLQIVPKRHGTFQGGGQAGATRPAGQPSPLIQASTPPIYPEKPSFEFPTQHRRRLSSVTTTPNTPGPQRTPRQPSTSLSQNFRFPATVSGQRSPLLDSQQLRPAAISRRTSVHSSRSPSPRQTEDIGGLEHLPQVTRILSASSMNGGTPRSSGEFYSLSNHSSETLASEYQTQSGNPLLPRAPNLRRQPNMSQMNQHMLPETLMMGYVQVIGSFTVDGSLINQAPFEEVKRKGVVGGQGGGGVVGVETNKRDSGILGAFGLGNIGASIGDLLGGNEMSTVKEMRGIANSKDIPLLSTPQSVLFVNLRLAPSESKTYSYSFTLPKGLPPSHKGRAIKVAYSLAIGTQRAATAKEKQQVRHVNVPFRIFGGVNNRGEVLGHDLMSPYVFLQDKAQTQSVEDLSSAIEKVSIKRGKQAGTEEDSLQGFLSYVDDLLERPREGSNAVLLSPSDRTTTRRHSFMEGPTTTKEAINLAILRSNLTTASNRSANRFEIARSGRRVAVIMLARPAYRLGETINAVINFEGADIPCYALHGSLETSETVDPAIALRSAASIHRVTRRIHASQSESTLFARRIVFAPTIPPNATPEFMTTGISLQWKLRFEFVTPRLMTNDDELEESSVNGLLEEVASDERGVILAAVETLKSESFEVSVPIKVFGALSGSEEKSVGGLVV